MARNVHGRRAGQVADRHQKRALTRLCHSLGGVTGQEYGVEVDVRGQPGLRGVGISP